MTDGCELFMCRFYPRDYSVSERRGEKIEWTSSTMEALQKIAECKQLIPDKTTSLGGIKVPFLMAVIYTVLFS